MTQKFSRYVPDVSCRHWFVAIWSGVLGPVHDEDDEYSVRSTPCELHVAMAEPPPDRGRHVFSGKLLFWQPWEHAASLQISCTNEPPLGVGGDGVGGDGPGGDGPGGFGPEPAMTTTLPSRTLMDVEVL